MRSRWLLSPSAGEQAPVEMRFIDMFMTALGSLVFISLLLVLLLPKTAEVFVQGTIVSQDGNKLQVKTPKGERTINLDAQTIFRRHVPLPKRDLKAGEYVIAAGKTVRDGSIKASMIEALLDGQQKARFVFLTGTLLKRADNQLTLQTQQDGVKIVSIGSSTKFGLSGQADATQFEPRDEIEVAGELNSDGSIKASLAQKRWPATHVYPVSLAGVFKSTTPKGAIVTLPSGRDVNISSDYSTRTGVSFPIPAKDIQAGQQVTVSGSWNADGSVTATGIDQRQTENPIPVMKSTIEDLERKLAQTKTEDMNILKRWFSVRLHVDSCRSEQLFFYVRNEGRLYIVKLGNMNDESDIQYAKKFDAATISRSAPWQLAELRTSVFGENYDELTIPDAVPKKLILSYHVIARSQVNYSAYLAVKDPGSMGEAACGIEPVFLTSGGKITGERIVLNRKHPFAWLRRFQVNLDGSSTLATEPKNDAQFLEDLAKFSAEQSKGLCDQGVCGTEDAHLYALRGGTAPFMTFDSFDLSALPLHGEILKDVDLGTCASKCEADTSCLAYTYDKWNRRCYRKPAAGTLILSAREISAVRTVLGAPGASDKPVRMRRYSDKAFAYDASKNVAAPTRSTSWAECEDRCRENEECVAYTYFRETKLCRMMKSADVAYEDSYDADSGAKFQEQ